MKTFHIDVNKNYTWIVCSKNGIVKRFLLSRNVQGLIAEFAAKYQTARQTKTTYGIHV